MLDHHHNHHPQRHHHDTTTKPIVLWGGHRKQRTTAVVYQMYTQTMPKVLASLLLASILLTSSWWAIAAVADGNGSSRHAVGGRQLAPAVAPAAVESGYGVDCSFPVFDRDLSGCSGILGDRKSFYESYMQGCRDHFATANPKKDQSKRCDTTEQDRLDMSRRQPQSMVVSFAFLLLVVTHTTACLFAMGYPVAVCLSLLRPAGTTSTTTAVVWWRRLFQANDDSEKPLREPSC
jgi:hypothetical protein